MSCCHPPGPEPSRSVADPGSRRPATHAIETVDVPAGRFAMGDAHDEGYRTDGEVPVHDVELGAFSVDVTSVTNAAFTAFVEATGYVSDAERAGISAVFHGYATAPGEPLPETPWWLAIPGASWRQPGGPGSDLTGKDTHPVVHVSHDDALAYCVWVGRALPTEAQWEHAARGGLRGARYPWGDTHPGPEEPRCNIFRGEFPDRPAGAVGTVDVRAFEPNGYGLYQCVGNVWEWCADRFSARYYRTSGTVDPTGPPRGTLRVLRGGSHLCHDSYCNRYRVAARSSNTPNSTASNIGFRTVGAAESVR